MNRVLAGMIAGTLATAPMTLAMRAIHQSLPREDQDPIGPAEVTENLEEQLGVADETGPTEHQWATTANHYLFGASAGALYGATEPYLPGPPPVRGVLFGMIVWSSSYMGWLPATGLTPPPGQRSAGWHGMMAAAHVVWGTFLGVLSERLED